MTTHVSPTASALPPPPATESAAAARDIRESMLALAGRLAMLGMDGWANTARLAARSTWAEIATTCRAVFDQTQAAQVIEHARGTWILTIEIGSMRSVASQIETAAREMARVEESGVGDTGSINGRTRT